LPEFTLGNFYCMFHTEAKARKGVNGDLHLYCFLTNSCKLTPTVI
jgi:hypothetical protein